MLSAAQVSVAAALKGLLQQMPTVTSSGSIHEQVIRQLPVWLDDWWALWLQQEMLERTEQIMQLAGNREVSATERAEG